MDVKVSQLFKLKSVETLAISDYINKNHILCNSAFSRQDNILFSSYHFLLLKNMHIHGLSKRVHQGVMGSIPTLLFQIY